VGGVPYLRAESEESYLLVRLSGTKDGQGGLYRFALRSFRIVFLFCSASVFVVRSGAAPVTPDRIGHP
jgi:hypothetical protein